MKTRTASVLSVLSVSWVLSVSSLTHAAPADDLAAAARKLADAPNYAWTATTEIANAPFPAMPLEGVAEKGGFTVTTRTFNGNTSQTVRKGTEVAMQNRDGEWMTMEEMRAQFAGGAPGGAGGQGGGQRGGGRGGWGGGMLGGAGNPAEVVAGLAAKIKDLKVADGALVATASGDDAAALLAPAGGRGGPAPGGARYSSVTLKFWLKDGALAQYSTHTVGTFTLPNGDEREVDSTTTVEVKNVGTAQVDVPAAAKKKFPH
jgi:hypothetical protein